MYQIQAGEGITDADYTPRGGCRELIYSHDAEVIAEGPAETGKTLSACWKLHLLASKYPGSQWVILRKIQADLYGTVLQTWERVIKGAPVTTYGGEKPEKYTYSNDAVVWVAGLDKPGKVLSSERDGMMINQAEQLTLDDWESLTTRVTGRNAVVPFPQLFGDCNPGPAKHWIKERSKAKILRLIHTTHKDNPTLYDDAGALTVQGQRTIERLGNLSGMRRKRLFEGIWATAEGVVYDTFDGSTGGLHVKIRPDSEMVAWYLAMDEGYTNPAVILLIGIDSDGRWHVAREWYERGRLESVVIEQAKAWYLEKHCKGAAVDAAAASLIAGLRNAGINAHAAKGRVLDGIQHMQDRLKVQADGLPRYTVDPSCVNVINEKESYIWKVTAAGTSKDEPVKENDHANDAERYLDDYLITGFDPSKLVDWA